MRTTELTDAAARSALRPTDDPAAPGRTDGVPEPPAPDPDRPPYRLRDLDRRGRLWAAAFALALVLAPVQAYLQAIDDWLPAGDPARIAIQTLNVGGERTPLTGQPSTSGSYVDADKHVDHPGPLHYYLMAGPVRAFGLHVGMLGTSVVIMSTCALLSAWATFRRLGPTGGVVAAVVIGLTMFTTGTASLTVPISSNIAGYPLFCAAVLLWCVLRGDLRLLPLAAAMTTFAAQQHLSVLPTVAVLVPAALAGLLWHWGRNGRWRALDARRRLGVWAGAAALVSLALWTPMLFQEVTNTPGNLTSLVELTGDDDRPTVGAGTAVNQMTHVLGLPPELGRTDLGGTSAGFLLRPPPLTTTFSALAVVAVLGFLARHWIRREQWDRASLVVMAGVLVGAGFFNGSSVVEGVEAVRMVFYHWIWPLTFFVVLALVLGGTELLRYLLHQGRDTWPAGPGRRPGRWPERAAPLARPALLGVALVAVIIPAAVNPSLDRPSSTLWGLRSPVERSYVLDLTDQVLDHRHRLEEPFLVTQQGQGQLSSVRESLALYLIEADLDARLPHGERFYVADNRIAWEDQVEGNGGLLLVHDFSTDWREVDHGELIADVVTVDPDTVAAADEVREALDRGPVEFGPEIRSTLDQLPTEWVDLAEEGRVAEATDELQGFLAEYRQENDNLDELQGQLVILMALDAAQHDATSLADQPEVIDFLIDHPLEQPRLDPAALERLREDDLADITPTRPLRLRVYLLTADELDAL